jgi:hypothetical protein
MKLDDSVDNLGRSTESLLRTMRLDVVLLGSQQDEARSTLAKLEQDWEMLQKLLAEQSKKERREEEEEETKSNDGNNQKQQQPKFRPLRRHSSIEWSAHGSEEGGTEQDNSEPQQQQTTTTSRTMNLSDYSNPDSSNKSIQNLDNSNFDWGMCERDDNDELEQEDRKADQSAPLTVDNVLNQAKRNNERERGSGGSGGDDLPPVKRMFGWGRDNKRDTKISNNSYTTPREQPDRPSFYGRRGKKQEGDDAASAITEGTVSSVNSFSWQKLFRRDGSHRNGMVNEKKLQQQQPSNSLALSSNTEKDLSDAISTMQVKLRGCDSAASSLQQLLSYQKRQITDLQHERNRLKLLSEFESLQGQLELKSLRTQLESAQAERARKIRLLKEAENSRSICMDKEEKVKEELECVRMELFMLNNHLESSGR